MKESDNQNNSKTRLKYIVIALIFISGVSVITSYVTVKTLTPSISTSTTAPIILPTIQSSPTLYVLLSDTPSPEKTQKSEFEEPLQKNDGFEVETNLLQNSGFENGPSIGWTAGINIFETTGVNGKGFCSRREIHEWDKENINREWLGFSQKIPLDPNQDYFFSAWLKLNESRNFVVYAKFYDNSETRATQYFFGNYERTRHAGETSNGWFFIHSTIDPTPLHANYIEINFVHGKLDFDYDTAPLYSTFCVDDVFLGKIVK